ncbi:MAG: hypothetical protein ACP5VP_08625 [Candidatus Limnocylindrales bacterium]
MRINRRFLDWGVFFITLGAVPLLVRQGILSNATAAEAWRLWPLVIVGIGAGILLRRTPAAFAGGLLVAATFGLVLGGLLASGPGLSGLSGCGDPNAGVATATSRSAGSFAGPASARIRMDCGVLRVSTRPRNGWSFQGTDPEGGAAVVTEGPASLVISAPARSNAFWNQAGGHNRSWQVDLPEDVQLDLTVNVNAGSGRIELGGSHLGVLSAEVNAADVHVDLTGASVSSLQFKVNAGAAHLSLPAASNVSGTVQVNAGSLDLCLPAGTGLRIQGRNTLSSTNLGNAGQWAGDSWTSSDYATAATRIDLQLDANLAAVNLNPAGGCQ